jgi:hypothetical protein
MISDDLRLGDLRIAKEVEFRLSWPAMSEGEVEQTGRMAD